MEWIIQIITFPAEVFKQIISHTGTMYVWLGSITIVLIFRYFVFPLVGTETNIFKHIGLTNNEKTGKSNNLNTEKKVLVKTNKGSYVKTTGNLGQRKGMGSIE